MGKKLSSLKAKIKLLQVPALDKVKVTGIGMLKGSF